MLKAFFSKNTEEKKRRHNDLQRRICLAMLEKNLNLLHLFVNVEIGNTYAEGSPQGNTVTNSF